MAHIDEEESIHKLLKTSQSTQVANSRTFNVGNDLIDPIETERSICQKQENRPPKIEPVIEDSLKMQEKKDEEEKSPELHRADSLLHDIVNATPFD